MPSMTHEGILQIFRTHPELAPALLRDVLNVKLPTFTSVRIESADLTVVKPKEYRADLVILLVDGKPVLGVVIEAQLERKLAKRRSWPAYIVNLRARLKCPVCLLVIAPDAGVAGWCAQPIEMGHPGFVLTPLVLGPDAVPVITDVGVARRMPEVAVLSVMAHGKTEHGFAIALAVLKAADQLDDERKVLYADLSYISVNEATRRKLEQMMQNGYEFQSDFAKKYFGQGCKEGEAKGRAAAVIAVLEARGLKISKANRAFILGCSDMAELDRWIRRAAVVRTARELFEEPTS